MPMSQDSESHNIFPATEQNQRYVMHWGIRTACGDDTGILSASPHDTGWVGLGWVGVSKHNWRH